MGVCLLKEESWHGVDVGLFLMISEWTVLVKARGRLEQVKDGFLWLWVGVFGGVGGTCCSNSVPFQVAGWGVCTHLVVPLC